MSSSPGTGEPQRCGSVGEVRFELLLQSIRDYAIYMLDVEGRVSSWNTGAERFKGYTADEIIGQHFSRFYTPEDREKGIPALALRTALEQGKFEAEGWRVRKDGTPFWTSVVIDPVYGEDGRHLGFAKVTRDISERRRAQEEIERTRQALSQAQKMEAIGRLTGGVAHDFNNLLTVIRSSADLLQRPDLPEEKRARYVQAIADTADRAARITGQLLAFARRQPLRPERFAVAERVRGMEQILGTTLGDTAALTIDIADAVGSVEADPSQFETAILNLVINARDAMPDGGSVRITAARTDAIPAIRGHAAAHGAFVEVAVADTGSGIAPETLERIFEPFFTTKPVNKGTGLGLSQIYGFAKQSGGDIAVASRAGEGSRFSLFLPCAEEAPSDGAEAAGDRPTPIPARHVLLVEDNETVGECAGMLLAELGQTVRWAKSGAEALQVLEEDGERFDLVFSDVVMPGMDGITLGQQLRRRWPALRVVLTSGYSHVLAEDGHHGFAVVQKPYSLDVLRRMLVA
ncbi:PAS domain S-box protein [Sphingomonas sp. ac-8]|uniref:PAS domain-containing sensor histidine kinase n=1 Tax=Sphingomonas sp. ac-8 TaxID=3242977 RepID=UPI003A7FCA21